MGNPSYATVQDWSGLPVLTYFSRPYAPINVKPAGWGGEGGEAGHGVGI